LVNSAALPWLALLHPPAHLRPASVAFRSELLGLRPLLGRQQREDVRPKPRLRDRDIGLRLRHLLSSEADRLFIHRVRVCSLSLRGNGRPQPFDDRAILFAVLLRQRPDLLLLRLGEIQGAQRQPGAPTGRARAHPHVAAAAIIGARPLRECCSGGQNAADNDDECKRTKTFHWLPSNPLFEGRSD
jgi:hypothetical protein